MAGPRGEYAKSAMRRAQILDAAFDVFARSGYSASSVNEIARTVGISQTAVLHHFSGGKPELLRAVLEQRDAMAEGALADHHGREFLAELVEISRRQARQRGVVQLYRILSAEATDPQHPAHEYFRARIERIADAVTHAFSEAQEAGDLKPGVDPRLAALNALAMVEGLEMLWLSGLEIDMAESVRRDLNAHLVAPL
ncbi:helix-turn-helix domain-containing protein [Microbacterium sp. AZCO]|uniref:helix-turn-helix domain-containing protein n=1 Tax=Microbacterium sp. AZCO TaxID=3142976 RepID=UPI0031F3B75B